MGFRSAAFVWVLLASGVPARAAGPLDDGEREPPKNAKCVEVRPEARFSGYGYDHIVEIENNCDKVMSCVIKTDVNPEPTRISVAVKEKKSVVTFRGSPAREFRADVQCKPEG
jgi:hypothetical protein